MPSAVRPLSPLTILLLIGCGGIDQPLTDPTPPVPGDVATVNAKPAPSTPLAMTVEDAGPNGPYRIRSDGLGEYVNGVLAMLAEIDQYGNLQITPQGTGLRTLTFDYSVQVQAGTVPFQLDPLPPRGFKIKSNKVTTNAPRIQDLGVSGNPASACYNVTITWNTGVTAYTNQFGYALPRPDVFVYITRTAISPAAWTMVTDGPCLTNPNWARVEATDLDRRDGVNYSGFFGYYDLRFSILLREL